MALGLLRKIHEGQDLRGEKSGLYYLRDKEKREVDFLTVIDRNIQDLVEVKQSDDKLSSNLAYFSQRLMPERPAQVVLSLQREQTVSGIPIVAAANWLSGL